MLNWAMVVFYLFCMLAGIFYLVPILAGPTEGVKHVWALYMLASAMALADHVNDEQEKES